MTTGRQDARSRWATGAVLALLGLALAVSSGAQAIPPHPTYPPPNLIAKHTRPASTADGMKTTVRVASTCNLPLRTCSSVQIYLRYSIVRNGHVHEETVYKTTGPQLTSATDFVYPSDGTLLWIQVVQDWADTSGGGTVTGMSGELPVEAPEDVLPD